MKDKWKSKEQLVQELVEIRQRLAELTESEAERKRAEEALRASEAKSRALLEGSPVCTKLLDLDLRLQFMSAAGQEMLCIADINPFYGRPYADVYAEPHRTRIIEHLERAKAGEVVSLEAPAYDLEGREGWYHTTFVPVSGDEGRVEYIISTSVDITERKQAEEELERLSRQHQLILNSAGEGIYGLDLEGRTTFCNPAAARMMGWEVEELLGKPQHDILHHTRIDGSPYPREECPIYAAFNDGKVHHVDDEVFWRKDGTSFPVEYTSTPIRDERGELVGAVVTYRDITERKRTEEALEESDLWMRNLFNSLEEAVFMVTPDRVVEGMNAAAEKMFGYTKEEVENLSTEVLHVDHEHYLEFGRRINETFEKGESASFEFVLKRKNGEIFPSEHTVSLLKSDAGEPLGIVSVVRDITERKKAEESLRVAHKEVQKAREYLETLIEDSLDAIISTDKEGMVVLFNKGAEVLLGYRREEVFGQRVTLLYESEERAKEVMRQMRERGGRVAGFETILRAKGGSIIPVLISASILYDEEGEEAGTVGFNKDLRERKRAKEQLIRSDKLAALGSLTAGVSHEVLNPLNIIMMSFQLMIEDRETPPEIVRQLRVLDEQAHRISKITQELTYFGRQREPERRFIDLNEAVSRTLGLLEKELGLRNIAVELRFSDGLEDILADQDQLQQVVLNLLTNAQDAMPDGGLLILSTEVVEADGQRFVELRVEDTGKGIAPEHLGKLFDPFFTTKAEGEGTGIGLSICHGIVEAHGGSIWAESDLGRGTTFIIQLPL